MTRTPPRFAVALALATLALAVAVEPAWGEDNPTPQHLATDSSFLIGMPALTDNPSSVCIVDRGVTPNPDLEGALSGRESTVSPTPDDDGSGHGTYVAEVAVAQPNGWGTIGAWPAGRVYSVRALPPGQELFSPLDIAHGILKCVDAKLGAGVKIAAISISLGGPGNLDPTDQYAIDFARAHGINVVASAGNGAGPTTGLSAAPGVFAVGAGAPDGSLCDFASRGPDIDLLALGCGVDLGNAADGTVLAGSGSSLAAPFVAAVLAALRDRRPELGVDDAESLLVTTAQRQSGWPVLDAGAAFRAAGLGALVDSVTPPPRADTAPPSLLAPASAKSAVQACRDSPSRRRWCVLPSLITSDRPSVDVLKLRLGKPPLGADLLVRVDNHHPIRTRRRVVALRISGGVFRIIRAQFVRGARKSLILELDRSDLEPVDTSIDP